MSGEFCHRLSLALNAVLAITVGGLALHRTARGSVPATIAAGPGTTNGVRWRQAAAENPVIAPQPALAQYSEFPNELDRRRWIIDELRKMGVPNDALALVARADFEVQWEGRFEACGVDRAKLAAAQLDMDLSKDAEMRAALGDAGFKQWDQKNMLWEAMSTEVDTTPSEADAIYALKKKLQQRELELEKAKVKGTMDDAEINDAEDKAYSEYNQQFKAVLGEARYAKSQQTDDAFVSGNLRYVLSKAGINADDSQFQALFKADQDLNQAQLKLDPASSDYAAQNKALNEAHDRAYRQALGSDGFDTFQKRQDPGYCQMKKYEALWGLDDTKVDYVYNTMKTYEKSVQDYKAQIQGLQAQGQPVNWDAVDRNLKQITDQTGDALQNYLGQDSFNKLQRNRLFLFKPTQPSQ